MTDTTVCARSGCGHISDVHTREPGGCLDCSCKGYVDRAEFVGLFETIAPVEPKRPALYQLAQARQRLVESIDVGDGMADPTTGELSPYDVFEAALSALDGPLVERATAVCWVLGEFKRKVAAVKGELGYVADEQNRLRARREGYERAAERLKDYLRENLRASKLPEEKVARIKTDTLGITVSEPGSTLDRDALDVKALPREWVTVETVTTTTPKYAAIEAALKRGETVPGASLKATKAAIRIT